MTPASVFFGQGQEGSQMQDVLGQQINVGDYVAYAHRDGMMVARVGRVEEYWTNYHIRPRDVRIVGKYARAVAHKRWDEGQSEVKVSWKLMNNGAWRPLHSPERAMKIDPSTLPRELISALTGETLPSVGGFIEKLAER